MPLIPVLGRQRQVDLSSRLAWPVEPVQDSQVHTEKLSQKKKKTAIKDTPCCLAALSFLILHSRRLQEGVNF
jgi:hypothetical protein